MLTAKIESQRVFHRHNKEASTPGVKVLGNNKKKDCFNQIYFRLYAGEGHPTFDRKSSNLPAGRQELIAVPICHSG
ncbi:hypothetical protein [Sphingobacterium lumbrici]|uniref:hypothetical protein n=1 Tax=Sphingobacterium lumbrici TaxID=2559600 RepID=UPI0011278813|nr:hypothetical protein [Sphingobacterium lumbrici]